MVHLSPRRSSQLAFWLLSTPSRTGCRQIAYGWMLPRRSSSGLARGNNWPNATWHRWPPSLLHWFPTIQSEIWVFFWTVSSPWMLTSNNCAGHVSSSYEGCAWSETVCRKDLCWLLHMLSFTTGWTTATASCSGSRLGGWIDYSPFSTPQRDWSSTFWSSRESRRPSAMSCTGSLLCFDPNTNFLSLCGTVLLVPPLCICGNYALRLPPSQVVSISDLLPETTS